MTNEDSKPPQTGNEFESYTSPGMKNVTLNYVLYLVGFIIPLVPIVGLVFAYMARGKAGADADSHYTYQIRTFWIGLVASLIAFILAFVLIGFLLLAAIAIWFVVRCVKGLMAASNNKPIADPQTYLI
ncbi:MAG: DUF4013 domain-containing protein [Pseudomonadota bacterium]